MEFEFFSKGRGVGVFVRAEGQGFLGEGWKGRDASLRNGKRGAGYERWGKR